MTINIILNTILCLLGLISSSLSGRAVHSNKKIKSKLNLIEKRIIKKNNQNDEIKAIFIEFENKLRNILDEKK